MVEPIEHVIASVASWFRSDCFRPLRRVRSPRTRIGGLPPSWRRGLTGLLTDRSRLFTPDDPLRRTRIAIIMDIGPSPKEDFDREIKLVGRCPSQVPPDGFVTY
jgi:hypothetical protein